MKPRKRGIPAGLARGEGAPRAAMNRPVYAEDNTYLVRFPPRLKVVRREVKVLH